MEEDFGPLTERISSLVEISSLVKTTCPLNQFFILWIVTDLFFVGSEVCIIELLLPGFDVRSSGWIKEATIGSLEFTLTNGHSGFSTNALVQFLVFLVRAESERIDPVGTGEKLGLSGIGLHILPTSMGPSTRNKLEVLLWRSGLLLDTWIIATWTDGSSLGLVASAVVEDVITTAIIFSSDFFHCCLSIYENLH